jgi:AcrR family transcriptional regulator
MSAPQRRRNEARPAPALRKGERRRQLLACARHLFAARGYRGTAPAEVAAAAGVREATLARHFDGTRDLFLAVLGEACETTLARWEAETAAAGGPLARLHALAEWLLAAARGRDDDCRVLQRALAECDDADVAARLRAFFLGAEALLVRVIAEGQQSGVFRRSIDPRVGAWEILRTAVGYAATLPLSPPLFAEPEYPSRSVECLLHGLLKTDV